MLDCRITSELLTEQQGTCSMPGKRGKFRLEAVFENHTGDETELSVETELLDGEQVNF